MVTKVQSSKVENVTLSFYSGRKDCAANAYEVCVIVPVRNEANHLYQTLDALRLQVGLNCMPLPPDIYEVLVLVNNSSDDSCQIARQYVADFPDFNLSVANIHLDESQAHIGTVRRLLMDEAYKRLTRSFSQKRIIASTDGDTLVDSQWISQIIAEIDKGNDAVGGRILTRRESGNGRAYHLRDVTYRCLLAQAECILDPQIHNPYPCHHQYFGANMAVTADMYQQAGRLPVVPFLEDVAFHKALVDHDAKIRNSFSVKVYTSSRKDGRVAVGFSEQLRRWQNEEKIYQTQMVEDVQVLLDMFRVRNFLRKSWSSYQQNQKIDAHDLEQFAIMFDMDCELIKAKIVEAKHFGQFWHAFSETTAKSLHRTVTFQPIKQAILQLRKFIKNADFISSQRNLNDNFQPVSYVRV
ncbi:glycosyltransferase [Dyadobacter luticola]|uniref:glycosyltransferase n=1 Tax=Dyadobacter luticola TaxID=1979387 RepID=UPI0014866F85|nr:glycosyltransferase [Dyadobacter luticola]